MVDFLCPFHTCFRHHHVHDFLQQADGVIWCFKFNCEVSSVGCAFKRYHSASVHFVCKRTIKPETDPLSLLCHGFDHHQRPSHFPLADSRSLACFLGPWSQANVDPRPTQQTCQLSRTVLQPPRPSGICTFVLLDAVPALRFSTLLIGFLQRGPLTQCCHP